MTNGSLKKVESIVECSNWKPICGLFKSGRLRRFYCITRIYHTRNSLIKPCLDVRRSIMYEKLHFLAGIWRKEN